MNFWLYFRTFYICLLNLTKMIDYYFKKLSSFATVNYSNLCEASNQTSFPNTCIADEDNFEQKFIIFHLK